MIPHLGGAPDELVAAGTFHAVDAQVGTADADGVLRRPGPCRVVLGGHQPVPRVEGSGHRRTQIDVTEPEHQVLGVEHDVVHVRHLVQPVDPPDEFDVVTGTTARRTAHRACSAGWPRGWPGRPRTTAAVPGGWAPPARSVSGSSASSSPISRDHLRHRQRGRIELDLQRAHARRQFGHARSGRTLDRCSCNACTRARRARSSTMGPYSTRTPPSPHAPQRDVGAVAGGESGQHTVVAVAAVRQHQRERRPAIDVERAQRRCPVGAHRDEPHRVARRHLTQLPAIAADHGDRADEAAEAGSVGAEQDRGVAGEVQCADAVGVVVDVRRMQAGLTAVGAGPLRLRPVEAHSGAVGVEMHGVVGAEQGVDVGAGEELRRAVRSLGDRDLPAMPDAGLLVDRGAGVTVGPVLVRPGSAPTVSMSPARSGAPVVAAERAQRECGCAAEVFGLPRSRRPPARSSAFPGPVSGPTSSTPPAGTVTDCHCGTASAVERSTLTGAPVTHTRPPSGKRSAGPPRVHSSPAAPSGLPSTRLPIRNDRSSIGPDGGTPMCQ